MGVVMQNYQIDHNGNIVEFKELWEAWAYCDEHGLKRCPRLWEKDGQPYLRGITKGGELVNARPE